MKFIQNPPDASSLMTSARSFGNYDLPGAIADLIDNSIKAQSRNIRLSCLYNSGSPKVSVVDDGYGMTEEELHAAMRPASSNPVADRSPDDLGRFGWGMKSASFSQCKKLTVISRKNGNVCGAQWDLDNVHNWTMGVLSVQEAIALSSLETSSGTEVLWTNCDRLSENGTLTEDEFNVLIVYTRNRIALIYHRYLTRLVRKRPLMITLNGLKIEGYDPFYLDHKATQELEKEDIRIDNRRIHIQPYILPHYSKITLCEYDRLGGEEGFLRNQGFYVYRNDRLIINGTWFRLAKHGELSQLLRVSVDIPNSLDEIWKITIDKGDAQLPAVLKNRLKPVVEGLKKRSSRVFRSRGGRVDHDETTVWNRHARSGMIRYSINRKHPLVAALLSIDHAGAKSAANAVIEVIEQSFPVTAFSQDSTKNLDQIHQTEADPRAFRQQIEAALPMMLNDVGGDFIRLAQLMKHTEPFSRHWKTVNVVLEEKGWSSAGT